MKKFLHGLSLQNYRGIGEDAQFVSNLKRCNFFIGANNSGKSIFLNFISKHLNTISGASRSPNLTFAEFEPHVGKFSNQVRVSLGFTVDDVLQCCLEKHGSNEQYRYAPMLRRIIEMVAEDGTVWLSINTSEVSDRELIYSDYKVKTVLDYNSWAVIEQTLTSRTNSSISNMVENCLEWIASAIKPDFPNSHLIPAMRQIGSTGQDLVDFSGNGLIDRLAKLQNPGPTDRHLQKKFIQINNFLKEITGDDAIEIEVPHDKLELLVHKDGRVLPLSSLGTGIHEVVMISAFCTLIDEELICIEEPEIHLHPLLQKKLIRYLAEKTKNQYFIATHSPSIIDVSGAAVFHVKQVDSTTTVKTASLRSELFKVCQELGYRASDLLQANFIVWVEGPTDRIYINHWLKSRDNSLVEGTHYSIMFYGGRLLCYLSADDEEVEDFISLHRLNGNMAIVIDSDKGSSESELNETKRRVCREFLDNESIAWVTAGREIENYLSPTILEHALKEIYSNYEYVESDDVYSHRLSFHERSEEGCRLRKADKVKVAREVTSQEPDFAVLDLDVRVQELVGAIRAANH